MCRSCASLKMFGCVFPTLFVTCLSAWNGIGKARFAVSVGGIDWAYFCWWHRYTTNVCYFHALKLKVHLKICIVWLTFNYDMIHVFHIICIVWLTFNYDMIHVFHIFFLRCMPLLLVFSTTFRCKTILVDLVGSTRLKWCFFFLRTIEVPCDNNTLIPITSAHGPDRNLFIYSC
jgi:hypothetical protein